MGIMDKIKKATGVDENYDEMYGNDIYDGYGYEMYPDNEDDADSIGYGPASSYGTSSSDATSATTFGAGAASGISIGGASLEMKVVKPEHYESVPQIANHLLNKRTVVLNLENTNKETARRLIDFLSGVAYSIDGSLKKIASNAYVITPNNVDVDDAQLKSGARQAAAPKAEEAEAPAAEQQFGEM